MHALSSENTGNDMPTLTELQRLIACTFHDAALLQQALTHKSYSNENKLSYHNERLEFLGDAVLNLVVSEHLMKTCPDISEGDLSRLRAAVVSEPALASVARKLGLGEYILLGKGEEQTGGRDRGSLLSDCMEALIASVYLDGGQGPATALVMRLFGDMMEKTCASGGAPDYKTELQELCQERLRLLPQYRVLSETGPDHRKQFEVELTINGRTLGRGAGRSKKEAEQKAAKEALGKLQKEAEKR